MHLITQEKRVLREVLGDDVAAQVVAPSVRSGRNAAFAAEHLSDRELQGVVRCLTVAMATTIGDPQLFAEKTAAVLAEVNNRLTRDDDDGGLRSVPLDALREVVEELRSESATWSMVAGNFADRGFRNPEGKVYSEASIYLHFREHKGVAR